jgi:DNA-binding transcriptional LysR family regulator
MGSGMRQFVEEYLEQNGVLRQQLRTVVDLNSTEGIVSAVEAGLGIGFVPYLSIEKSLALGTVKAIQLDNGPIRRKLSIVLLNGPDPRGPVGQLVDLLRGYDAANLRAPTRIAIGQDLKNVIVIPNANHTGHEETAS